MSDIKLLLPAWLSLLLCACGGDGSGGAGPVSPLALSYSTPPAFTINKAIAALTPTVNGVVTSYSVSPAMPAGLAINASSGVISGTPTTITPKTVYTVTASNAGESTSTSLTLVVNDVSPTSAYASSYYSFTVGVAANSLVPTSSGGKVTSWTVNPALPAGLELDSTSGVISGTPTTAAPPASYTVTASNSGGIATATLAMAVSAGPLLDVGHAVAVNYVGFSGSIVMSEDRSGHWALWNYGTDIELASGDASAPLLQGANQYLATVALAGSTAVAQTASGLTVLNAASGTVQATIATTLSWWQLAIDGSYVCAGSTTALTVWSPSGQVLLTQSGDYSAASVFAASGQVQVALGPSAGAIQTINLSTKASSVSPAYQGTFLAWFSDGGRFLTSTGSNTSNETVFVYSNAGAQQELLGPGINIQGGVGNWLWGTSSNTVSIYAVGGGTTPAASYPYNSVSGFALLNSGSTLALVQGTAAPQITLVDLSGAAPSMKPSAALPIGGPIVFAATSSSTWVIGNSYGVLLDGASLTAGSPRYLDYGQVLGIAGSASDFAIATASGRILVYSSSNNALLSTINFASSTLALSSDGTVLAAFAADTANPSTPTLNVYALPAGTTLNSVTYGSYDVQSLSSSGSGTATLLGISFSSDPVGNCWAEVIGVTSSTPTLCYTPGMISQLEISPNGSMVAAAVHQLDASATTTVYSSGAVTSAVNAYSLGWLDNTTYLANTYAVLPPNAGDYGYSGAAIYNLDGTVQSAVSLLPQLNFVQVLSPSAVYAAGPNAVFSLPSGAETWASGSSPPYFEPFEGPPAGIGAVSGSEVIFPAGSLVLAQTMAAPSG